MSSKMYSGSILKLIGDSSGKGSLKYQTGTKGSAVGPTAKTEKHDGRTRSSSTGTSDSGRPVGQTTS